MKLILLSFFVVLAAFLHVAIASPIANKTLEDGESGPTQYYPNFWVINRVENWTASGVVGYSACKSGYFDNLNYGQDFTEWRGACLIRHVKAKLTNGGKEINAATYWSSGTGYAAFEIVRWGTEDNFCVRRPGTSCS